MRIILTYFSRLGWGSGKIFPWEEEEFYIHYKEFINACTGENFVFKGRPPKDFQDFVSGIKHSQNAETVHEPTSGSKIWLKP